MAGLKQNPGYEDDQDMPESMLLTKEGLKRVDYNPRTRKYEESLVQDPVIYLRFDCHVAEGFTGRDIVDFVGRHESLKSFISRYSQCPFVDAYHDESASPGSSTDLDAIEIYWAAEVCDDGGESTFSASPHMHGSKGEENWYGLDFMGLGEYAHLPLKMNKEFKVYGNGESERLLLSSSKEFSLLDILDAFYWTISYYGSPNDRAEVVREIHSISDELLGEDGRGDREGDVPGDPSV